VSKWVCGWVPPKAYSSLSPSLPSLLRTDACDRTLAAPKSFFSVKDFCLAQLSLVVVGLGGTGSVGGGGARHRGVPLFGQLNLGSANRRFSG
jgi:hypothetical protein